MRVSLIALTLAALTACGGSETPPAPPHAPAEAPKPEPAPAPPPAPAAEDAVEAAPAEDIASLSPEEQKARLMEIGKNVYTTGGVGGIPCQTCHMENGQGSPGAFPPLAGALDVMGDCTKHAGYVVKGLSGPITVNGTEYQGVMPAQANLSDLEIAAVITYERNSWGNEGTVCLPADVAAARN